VTERLSDRALNRALLARQGLLEPFDAPLAEVVESIGALQGQQYSALPIGLATRMRDFAPDALYAALERGELVWGILLRGTLHLVSAREHPAYAAAAHRTEHYSRVPGGETSAGMRELRAALLGFAQAAPRTNEEIRARVEDWVSAHPGAIAADELEAQRAVKWRPIYRWSALVRVPADGAWTSRAPADHRAAPGPKRPPSQAAALDAVIRRHLGAFGPAAAEDVAGWIGWPTPPVRDALQALGSELETFEDETGRVLYDLPGAPRPDPELAAPPRFLGAFDSTLLAYVPKRRTRILPDAHREAIYLKGNLRVLPTLLVDGRVAATWSHEVKRRQATLAVQPLERLSAATRKAASAEGERLLRAVAPEAQAHRVAFA
jgi:hypothetical protein